MRLRDSAPTSGPPPTAGVDTTVHALSAVLHAFAAHPGQWQRLREDPGSARLAFDEAVRRESPVPGRGEPRPRRWDDPDTFDLTRDPSGHVGFDMGLHQCVGQHVARLEAEALLTALVGRVRVIEPDGPPRRHHNNTLRAWGSLPVRVVL